MPKKKTKTEQREQWEEQTAEITIECRECGKPFVATKKTWLDKNTKKVCDVLITPPRCPTHQIGHAVNVRVNPTVKKIRTMKNLKPRIKANFGQEGLQAIVDELSRAVTELAEHYASASNNPDAAGFNLNSFTSDKAPDKAPGKTPDKAPADASER